MFGSRHWFGTPAPGPPVQPQPNAILMKKLWPARPEDAGALSHLGGDPMLPPEWDWPTCTVWGRQVRRHQPMHFLAQVDCAALPTVEDRDLLPERGILYFFALLDDGFGREPDDEPLMTAVGHFDGPPDGLRRRAPPPGTPSILDRSGSEEQRPKELYTPEHVAEADKRYGFVPLAFAPLCTLHDPSSDRASWSEEMEKGIRLARQAALRAALGPLGSEPPGPTSDPAWPETVLHAKVYLADAHRLHSRLCSRLDENLVAWRAGDPPNDKWLDWSAMTTAERKEKAIRWMWQRERHVALLRVLQMLLDRVETLPPRAAAPESIRESFRYLRAHPQMRDPDGRADRQAVEIALALSRHAPLEPSVLSPTSLAHARRTTLEDHYNANHLLGRPHEVQSESASEALDRLRARGIATPWDMVEDMRLLAQFDTCYAGACFMFADCGKLYLYAREADLKARRFDRVIAVVDGG